MIIKKIKNYFVLAIIMLLLSPLLKAVPIMEDGRYKGHTVNLQNVIKVDCGWQWWKTCWSVDNAGILSFGEPLAAMGTLSDPDGYTASLDYIQENIEEATFEDECGGGTSFTFSNLIYTPN